MSQVNPFRDIFAAGHFLIIEDFDAMRKVLRDLLRHCGAMHIEIAANGSQAMQALGRGRHDVILCDYNLGHGRSGQEVLEEARHQNLIGPATVYVMITGEKTAEMVMGAVELEADDYMLKPITESALLARLIRIFKRKRDLEAIQATLRAGELTEAITLCDTRMMAEDPASKIELRRIKAETLKNWHAQAGPERQFQRLGKPGRHVAPV